MNFGNFNKGQIKISKLLLLAASIGFLFSIPVIMDVIAAKSNTGLLPELRTVVPTHLGVQNAHQEEIIRFTNGIANLGPGDWTMDPIFPDNPNDPVLAIQKIFDSDGNLVQEKIVSEFQFHETHNHWHIANVALFEVHAGAVDGPIVGESVKQTFCIEDVYALEGNSNTKERVYWDCYTSTQGIQVGWVDQYHQSTDGQQIIITGAEPGLYYLVSTSNPDDVFIEEDTSNNTAWVSFELKRHSNGNLKITVIDHSPCESPGLCGEVKANR